MEMPHLSEKTVVHAPRFHTFPEEGIEYFLDPDSPHWIAADERGGELLRQLDGRRTFGDLLAGYAARQGLEAGKALLHVHDFLQGGLRAGFLTLAPIERPTYEGRLLHTRPAGLRELWLHTNNSCNLACTHCLVNSGPGESPGLPPQELERLIEACELGVERFYMTGGEPFLRPDLDRLIRRITEERGRELILLTNATLFRGPRGAALSSFSRELVKFQVSVDGGRPETNDPIRGAGTFERALDGVQVVADLGFEVSLTTVVTVQNLRELTQLTRLAAERGASSQHLMWSHKRGRAKVSDNGFFPDTADILVAVEAAADRARELGISLDNLEAARRHANGQPGVKYDLGNAGWDSVCVYADGTVYPSAALADHRPLSCGQVTD